MVDGGGNDDSFTVAAAGCVVGWCSRYDRKVSSNNCVVGVDMGHHDAAKYKPMISLVEEVDDNDDDDDDDDWCCRMICCKDGNKSIGNCNRGYFLSFILVARCFCFARTRCNCFSLRRFFLLCLLLLWLLLPVEGGFSRPDDDDDEDKDCCSVKDFGVQYERY